MSGGSFNYLYRKVSGELLDGGDRDLEDMVDALAATGYAPDAALETAAVLAEIRAARARLDSKLERLYGVWRSMEWWKSGDSSEQDLKRSLARYRGIELQTCKRCQGSGLEPNTERSACRNPDCANGKDTEAIR